MAPVDKSMLERWRALRSADVIRACATYAKEDSSYVPTKSSSSSRWHVRVDNTEFELLCTGPKYWDTRLGKGGGGAIDLVMHLTGMDFKAAASRLMELGL